MKLSVALGSFLLASVLHAAPLHHIVVFGDSLSDNGNLYELMKHQLPQSPPYYEGRFSDGPVWAEHLVKSYYPNNPDQYLLDYAVGGAGVSEEDDEVLLTLKKQVNNYLLAHHNLANADDLYVVWIGANNYLGLPEDTEQALREVNEGIVHSVQNLVEKGARHILFFNLPDLGKTPVATEFDTAEIMGYFSSQHNEMLYQSFLSLKNVYPELDWIYFDLNSVFTEAINNPADYGFTNVTDVCTNSVADDLTRKSLLKMVAQVTPKSNSTACNGYLFFDLVHPTGFAHRLIAEKLRQQLDGLGIEFAED